MIFHENHLLADDSQKISYLIIFKLGKMSPNLSSAVVVVGTLRVNEQNFMKIINEFNIHVQLYSWLACNNFYCLLTNSLIWI